ncbi:MAG: HD domain-containing phosphohydrolase, partial [Anaerolineales bacterium]
MSILRSVSKRLSKIIHQARKWIDRQSKLQADSTKLNTFVAWVNRSTDQVKELILLVRERLALLLEKADQWARPRIAVFIKKTQTATDQISKTLSRIAKPVSAEVRKRGEGFLAWVTPITRQFWDRVSAGAGRLVGAVWARLNPILSRLQRNVNQMLRDFYYPILTQVTVPYLMLALLVGLGGTYLVTQVVFDSQEERFTNQLIETALLTQESLVREEGQMLETLRLISNIQGVAQSVDEGNVQNLRGLILPIAYNSGIDAAIILDRNGASVLGLKLHTVEQSFAPFLGTSSLGSMGFVRNVLQSVRDELGDKFAGIVTTPDGDYFFLAGPIQDEDGRLVGAVLIGKSLENLTQLLREQAHGQVSIYLVDGAPLATTFTEPEMVEPGRVQELLAMQEEGSFQRAVESSGITYNELLSALEVRSGETVGLLGVALPTSFIAETSVVTREGAFGVVSFTLLVIGTIGFYVAGRITRPIQELRRAAMKVASGDLAVRVPDTRPDEVGVLTHSFNQMVDSLSRTQQELLDAYDRTIEGWARAVDLRDHRTEGHSRRVADLAVELGEAMGLKVEELENLRRGALLHDIGKIAVPDTILLKKGKLTAGERKIMQQHPIYGRNFLSNIEFLKPAAHIPYCHHEKWDGSGYPQGLKGT